PFHEVLQDAGGGVGFDGVGLAGEDFTGGAIERQPVAFFESDHLAVDGDGHQLLVLFDGDGFRAGDAGGAHAAADDGCVAGHTATRGQNALGDFHALNIVGLGFLADQYDGPLLGGFHRGLGGECDHADGGGGGR